MLGHGAHLAGRATRGDHHGIGNAGFAVKVDDDDVVSLVVFERRRDQGNEIFSGISEPPATGYGSPPFAAPGLPDGGGRERVQTPDHKHPGRWPPLRQGPRRLLGDAEPAETPGRFRGQ